MSTDHRLPAPTEDDLRLLLVGILDGLEPRLHPQLCCEIAMAVDALVDPAEPPALGPATPAPDVVAAIHDARLLTDRLLGESTSVAACLALGEVGRHLRSAVASFDGSTPSSGS